MLISSKFLVLFVFFSANPEKPVPADEGGEAKAETEADTKELVTPAGSKQGAPPTASSKASKVSKKTKKSEEAKEEKRSKSPPKPQVHSPAQCLTNMDFVNY